MAESQNVSVIVARLGALQACPVSMTLLAESRAGLGMKALRKLLTDEKVKHAAAAVVETWRGRIALEQEHNAASLKTVA